MKRIGCKTRCIHKTKDGRCPYSKCINPIRIAQGKEVKAKALKYMKYQTSYEMEKEFQKILDKGDNLWTAGWLASLVQKTINDRIQQLEEQHTINCKEWRTTKLRVYKRDHSQCIECGTKKHLSLHFKDFAITNYRDENLELLCRKCHWKKHLEAYNEVPLSEESKELVDKGLEEAKEGKIETLGNLDESQDR